MNSFIKTTLIVTILLKCFTYSAFGQNYPYITQFNELEKGILGYPEGVAKDSYGRIYVCESIFGRIQVLTSNGVNIGYFTHIPLKTNLGEPSPFPTGIAIDNNDRIFVSDGNNSIFLITGAGINYEVVSRYGTLGSGLGQLSYPYGVAVDNANKIYVTDRGNNRIQILTVNGIAMGYYTQFGSTGNSNNQLRYPTGIAVNNQGQIFIADASNNRIQVLTTSGTDIGFFTQFVSSGTGNNYLQNPGNITINTNFIYVTERFSNSIKILTITGNSIGFYSNWDNLGSSSIKLSDPKGMIFDASNNFIVVNGSYLKIFKINNNTISLDQTFGNPNSLRGPIGLAIDSNQNIFVSDLLSEKLSVLTFNGVSLGISNSLFPNTTTGNYRSSGITISNDNQVYSFDQSYDSYINILTITGNQFGLLKKVGGFGTTPGLFKNPWSGALDSWGRLYVTDAQNSRIQVFTTSGNNLTFLSQFGTPGTSTGQFLSPYGISIGGSGKIYVSDSENNRIQILTMTGNNLSYLSEFGKKGIGNGEFNLPIGLAVDFNENLYVADLLNNRIQVFTVSGNAIGYFSQFGGLGISNGKLFAPYFISVSNDGNIFVSDGANSRVQVFGGACPRNGSCLTVTDFPINEVSTSPFNIYPNPFTQSFKLEMPQQTGKLDISISNIQGNIILTKTFERPPYEIITEDLINGVYFLKASHADGSVRYKLVKE